LLTDRGIELLDVSLGPEGVLTGSSRISQEAREKAARTARQQEVESKQRVLNRKREALEAQIAALRREFEAAEDALLRNLGEQQQRAESLQEDRKRMAVSRHADIDEPARQFRKTRGVRK
jgi:circadian clock protein KaiC